VLADRPGRKRPLTRAEEGAVAPVPTARPRLGALGAGLVALRLDSAANNPADEGDSGQDVVDEVEG
jgi:hypothetical protein